MSKNKKSKKSVAVKEYLADNPVDAIETVEVNVSADEKPVKTKKVAKTKPVAAATQRVRRPTW